MIAFVSAGALILLKAPSLLLDCKKSTVHR
jgi:hypothetical protein